MPRSILSLLLVSVLTPAITAKGTKYALLIGVSKYDPKQLHNLAHAEKDATALADVLVSKCGFNRNRVYLMTSTEGAKAFRFAPSAKNIRRMLNGLIRVCEKDDTLILAFAGHGVQFAKEKDNFFCPTDADLEDRKSLINLQTEVYQALANKCKARVKLLFVDACRNDPRTKEARRKSVNISKINNPQSVKLPKGLAAFFSCQAGEEAYEHGKVGHGIFFHFLIKGLQGNAAGTDGKVTLPGLRNYVRREVSAYVFRQFGAVQRPQLMESSEDVITLIEKGQATLVKEITNSIGMKLRLIPAGTFTMGSPEDEKGRQDEEGPQHKVEITKPFYMGVYEVTQAEYEKVMGYNPSYFSRNGKEKAGAKYFFKPSGGKDRVRGLTTISFPVENVTWDEAVEFCKKLSELASEKQAGRVYRLPTEAEWEYACRGGAKKYQVFAFGNSLSSKQANFHGSFPYGGAENGKYLGRTCKVGSYQANGFGLYDMHGNVWEWGNDFYSDRTYTENKRTDPRGPKTGASRSLRGGSWLMHGHSCRSAHRDRVTLGTRNHDFGFRIICRPD